MNNHDENKRLLTLMESCNYGPEVTASPYGVEETETETESVTYSKTKSKGDASVTISANAKSMQELHDVLKLAGITLPADHPSMQEPEMDNVDSEVYGDEEPSTAVIVHPDAPEEPYSSDTDPAYTTDKQTIIDKLRDTLKAKLIR